MSEKEKIIQRLYDENHITFDEVLMLLDNPVYGYHQFPIMTNPLWVYPNYPSWWTNVNSNLFTGVCSGMQV